MYTTEADEWVVKFSKGVEMSDCGSLGNGSHLADSCDDD